MNTARSVTGIGVAVAFGAIVVSAGSAGGATRAGIPVFAWCALIAFGLQWLVFLPAWLAHSERFFDLTGSVTYLTVVLVALVASPEPGSRALLLGAMVVVWATRLGSFLYARVHAMGSDSRFDDMKHRFAWFLMTWTLQGLWVILTAAAALAAITAMDQPNLGPLDAVGLLVWASGLVFEVVADQQKRRFRSAAQNQGRFISTGLWARSRHPNYLGEIVLWVGVALVAAPALSGWSLLTLVSPVFVFFLLTRVSGLPLLEAAADRRWGGNPDYEAYKSTTPALVPRIR